MNKSKKNQWLCFKTNSREEFLARDILISKGFKILLPFYIKTSRHARRKIQVKCPIFPSYGFLQFDGKLSSLYTIKYSRGVKYYLQNQNGYPQIVSDQVIKAIQKLKQTDGSYNLNPNRFMSGDEVNIIEGVLTGIKAIFNEQIDEWRSRLVVNLLGRINEIRIRSQMIEKV